MRKIFTTMDGKEFDNRIEAFEHEKGIKTVTALKNIGLEENAIKTVMANKGALLNIFGYSMQKMRGRKPFAMSQVIKRKRGRPLGSKNKTTITTKTVIS